MHSSLTKRRFKIEKEFLATLLYSLFYKFLIMRHTNSGTKSFRITHKDLVFRNKTVTRDIDEPTDKMHLRYNIAVENINILI